MSLIKALYALIIALPEIIKLIKELEKRHQDEMNNKKIKKDLKEIGQAFEDRDPDKLNRIFNS